MSIDRFIDMFFGVPQWVQFTTVFLVFFGIGIGAYKLYTKLGLFE